MDRKYKAPKMPPGLPGWLAKAWMNDELEWDFTVSKTVAGLPRAEFKKWFNHIRSRSNKIGRRIQKEFERERKQLLAEARKKQKEYEFELVLMAVEEKHQAAVKAYLEQCQREAKAHIEKLRKAAP